MPEEDALTNEEREELYRFLATTGTPAQEEKSNVHSFLNKVATSSDTTKLGNISEEELGVPRHPERSLKNLALISKEILGNDYYSNFFNQQAEILTSTSLSKEGFLIRQATTTTRQFGDITKKPRKKNKGWFGKKNKEGEESQPTE